MSKVKMEKDNTVIAVDSSVVAEHQRLGWTIKRISNDLANADIMIGAQDSHTINVAIQLQDEDGAALAESMSVLAFLSDDAAGVAQTATAPDGHVSVGTNGGCVHLVTDKFFMLNTDASGALDLDLVESGADTWYLALVFPNGERVVSDAITFA